MTTDTTPRQTLVDGTASPAAATSSEGAKILSILSRLRQPAPSMETFYRQLQQLDDLGATTPLDADDFYRSGGGGSFRLLWPLSRRRPSANDFTRLSRHDQFSILFDEWQRRQSEASLFLAAGQLDNAELVFGECLTRARQLEVAELEARSLDGLRWVSAQRGDVKREIERLCEAARVRAAVGHERAPRARRAGGDS